MIDRDQEQGAPHTVVVAEPLALVREGFVALCESGGEFSVVAQCDNGEEAAEAVILHAPDIAVLDLNLARLFTLEAVRKIRQTGTPTKIVVLGNRTDRKTVMEVLRSGASAYLLKAGPGQHLFDAFRQIRDGGIYVSPLLDVKEIFLTRKKPGPDDPLEKLSGREYEVFTMLTEGIRAKEIAARLSLSPKTVDTYRASLMRKLDIHDVAGLVKFAIRRNLIRAG